ncbi:hypothetical protein SAMN05421810_105207 [Amycolatopsis arida]|uniref:Excreted virulence factor EspC, type VII ESX diderm n=1 Tax=Amycolatopsis arida TaxID=587909 RepID=A0A1I5WP81_9PSEU|nr:hypothetical protein [Amycolatopsis arida]TDX92381.1 hypothetical protein CLV69_105226 [Amycolatopsis arida]SFQ21592.1 hypothetical protein SAMN05421810_105207 [Amycolatopsis arida]
MPDGGFRAEPGVLDGIASTLRTAAGRLDEVGNSTPPTPDAGDASAAVAVILAKLTDSAGQLVIGTAAAGDAVADGGATYAETDASANEAVRSAGGR